MGLSGVKRLIYMVFIFLMFHESLGYELFLGLTVQNFSLITFGAKEFEKHLCKPCAGMFLHLLWVSKVS
jgi:hypothetical protein